jgi:hypothetical protein
LTVFLISSGAANMIEARSPITPAGMMAGVPRGDGTGSFRDAR